ncbi:MAG: enoyl-CoA hydratase/isomerase family protein [Oscillospiraceae bacterium]|nr:enoyl-CoA hydratase/isomerase family protein [Oscillospiraceae bacterium]
MYENIKYEKKGKVGYLTFNRPKALNALNTPMLKEIQDCLDTQINPDDELVCVVLTGEGRAFIAGADILEMKDYGAAGFHNYTAVGHKVMYTMETSDKVFIAAINGFALGGGLELAMSCDIRLASEKALFGQPETGLGIIPGFGGTQRMPRLVGRGMAKYLILAAENIKADEAYRIGLVEKIYAPDDLMPETVKLAESIAAKAPIAVRVGKAAINVGIETDIITATRYEREVFSLCAASDDKNEGMTAFVEKRAPNFQNK